MKDQESQNSRLTSNSNNKITLQSVKSEKRFGMTNDHREQGTSRISIGRHEK